jgi:hypothetical protein
MFNCAIVVCDISGNYKFTYDSPEDQILFMYRHTPARHSISNSIYIAELISPSDGPRLGPIQAIIEKQGIGDYEDARFILHRQKLGISYTWAGAMAMSYLTDEYKLATVYPTSFAQQMPAPQKNWTFFSAPGETNQLLAIVNYCPLEIYRVNEMGPRLDQLYTYRWNSPVQGLRGGAPPVFVDGKYYVLLHTAKTYRMYILVLDGQTLQPILFTPRQLLCSNATIEFPCGMLYNSQEAQWIISLGLDDTFCGIYTISAADVVYMSVNSIDLEGRNRRALSHR